MSRPIAPPRFAAMQAALRTASLRRDCHMDDDAPDDEALIDPEDLEGLTTASLEAEVASLRDEVRLLKDQFAAFQKQFE